MAKRTEKNTDITRIEATSAALGAFVDDDASLSGLAEYTTLPRLKIIQAMSDEALKDMFGEGGVVIRPGDALVAEKAKGFEFVPLAFYAEFAKWSDRRDKESDMIVQRSYDPTSEIAKRAKDKDARFEIYEGHEGKKEADQYKYRYIHHLNFPGFIYGDHPLAGTQVVLTFSKGEYGTGSRLINAMQLRRMDVEGESKRVPLWAQVWEFTSALRVRGENKWHGLDYQPAENPMILTEQIEQFREAHLSLTEMIEQKRLVTDHGEEDAEESAGVTSGDKF